MWFYAYKWTRWHGMEPRKNDNHNIWVISGLLQLYIVLETVESNPCSMHKIQTRALKADGYPVLVLAWEALGHVLLTFRVMVSTPVAPQNISLVHIGVGCCCFLPFSCSVLVDMFVWFLWTNLKSGSLNWQWPVSVKNVIFVVMNEDYAFVITAAVASSHTDGFLTIKGHTCKYETALSSC